MLHIVNKSPEQSRSLERCLRMARDGHSVLLVEDAVYAATSAGAGACGLQQAVGRLKLFVLMPDLEARGMAGKRIAGVEPVDYAGFVDLVATQPVNQSWL
ncbi:MAG: DsrH protein [Ramlibacter sp.]|jgi:tRNA 2-thiouridine synthesizing protein B|nr:DsrH protein [Ramlibacter sp.]